MRIDFLGLQAFLSIAQRGSFQRAAAHLNLSQTAISHRMRKLEDELGLKLFARTTREVTLTRAGIDFLPKAQKAIGELEQSFDELKQQGAKRRERLDIACLPVFAIHHLPPILSRFNKTHPEVEVRIFETPSAAIAALVQSGEVEFGLSVIQTNRWDLDVEAIGDVHLAPNWQYEVQHVETAVHLVEAGLGLAVVLSVDVALHRGRGIVAVPLRAPRVEVTYGLVTRRGMPLSPAAAAVRDLLVEELSAAGS